MTEKEIEQLLDRAVRAAIAAHPDASAETIADILAGPQTRDPREIEAGTRELVSVVISDLGATDPDDDNAIDEIATTAMRDVGLSEISAMAWLCFHQRAAKLLKRST